MRLKNELLLGILFILSASFCYSLGALVADLLQARIPLSQALFIQNIFSLILTIPSLRNCRPSIPLWKFHILRGAIGYAGIFAFYSSLKYLDFADAVVLSYASNLLIPALSLLFLKEPTSHKIWAPVGLGFIGIVIILQPSWGLFHLGSILALLSAGTSAVSMTVLRYLNLQEEAPQRTTACLFLISALLAFPFALAYWAPLRWQDWALLLILGMILRANQSFLTKGLNLCPTPFLIPFSYSSILYGVIFDWILWEKGFKGSSLLGAIFIMAGGIFVYRTQVHCPPEKKRKADTTASSRA